MPPNLTPSLENVRGKFLICGTFEKQKLKIGIMAKSVNEHKADIVKVLRTHKIYNKALDMQVQSLASAIRNLDMANEQIDKLTETTVYEETRYGSKLAPHPVFKIAKEAQELITRQMKALGLTAEDLAGETETDPLVDMTKRLARKRSTARTTKKQTTDKQE